MRTSAREPRALFVAALLTTFFGCAPLARADEVTPRIIDGTVDSSSSYVVALCAGDNPIDCTTVCGGTLIAPNLVLTSRHCADLDRPTSLDCDTYRFDPTKVVAPASMWVTTASPVASVATFHQGTQWDFPLPIGCGHDLALLTLSDSFAASDATPATPAVTDEAATLTGNDPLVAFGYGLTGPGDTSAATRRQSGTHLLCLGGRDSCRSIPGGETLLSTELAVGAQVCPGDSGAGLFAANGDLLGTLARSIGGTSPCADGVYTRLAFHDLLVARVTNAAAMRGSFEAPVWTTAAAAAGNGGLTCDGNADCASGLCRTDDLGLTWSCVSTCDGSCSGACETVPDDQTGPGGSFCFPNAAPPASSGCEIVRRDHATSGYSLSVFAVCALLGMIALRARRARS